MNLVRRCPFCGSTNVDDKRIYGSSPGEFSWGVGCVNCGRTLEHFEVVDTDRGELVATAAGEGEHKRVDWHKSYNAGDSQLWGRNKEGMAR